MFQRKYVYTDPSDLDLDEMRAAAEHMLGQHDFSAFCAKATKKSTVRYIESLTIERQEQEIRFTVTGNGFLHHMVRIMVSTLLEVGRGERKADSIPELFGARREMAGPLIPACGLCLMEVTY